MYNKIIVWNSVQVFFSSEKKFNLMPKPARKVNLGLKNYANVNWQVEKGIAFEKSERGSVTAVIPRLIIIQTYL